MKKLIAVLLLVTLSLTAFSQKVQDNIEQRNTPQIQTDYGTKVRNSFISFLVCSAISTASFAAYSGNNQNKVFQASGYAFGVLGFISIIKVPIYLYKQNKSSNREISFK